MNLCIGEWEGGGWRVPWESEKEREWGKKDKIERDGDEAHELRTEPEPHFYQWQEEPKRKLRTHPEVEDDLARVPQKSQVSFLWEE